MENGRVRNDEKIKGLLEHVRNVWDRKELSQEVAGRQVARHGGQASGGREGRVAWRIMSDITTEE